MANVVKRVTTERGSMCATSPWSLRRRRAAACRFGGAELKIARVHRSGRARALLALRHAGDGFGVATFVRSLFVRLAMRRSMPSTGCSRRWSSSRDEIVAAPLNASEIVVKHSADMRYVGRSTRCRSMCPASVRTAMWLASRRASMPCTTYVTDIVA